MNALEIAFVVVMVALFLSLSYVVKKLCRGHLNKNITNKRKEK